MEKLLEFLKEPNPPDHEILYVGKVSEDWITDHQPFITDKGEVYIMRHKVEEKDVKTNGAN